jgi:hypothetical protein
MGSTPSAPAPPPAPDYAKANRDGVMADIDTLETRGRTEYLKSAGQKGTINVPIYDGNGVLARWETREVDFTGMGDKDLALLQQQQDIQGADAYAQAYLDLNNRYGSQFIDQAISQVKQSDPQRYALIEAVANQVASELALGNQLTPEQQRLMEQQMRKSQTARGQYLGNAAALQETMAVADRGDMMKQQRLNNAYSYLGLMPTSSQFGSNQTAQSGATPFNALGSNSRGVNINPYAALYGTEFAKNTYETASGNWRQQASMANNINPWMSGFANSWAGSLLPQSNGISALGKLIK